MMIKMRILNKIIILALLTVIPQISMAAHKTNHFLSSSLYPKGKKYSLFESPTYLPEKPFFFKTESADKKYGLYFKGIMSAHGDAFYNTQGIIMNMGVSGLSLYNMSNVYRTWIYQASPIIGAKLDDHIHLLFNPDFGQNQYRIFEANVDINYYRSLSILAGFQSALISGFSSRAFNYRSFTSNMSPFKETAFNLYGEIGPSLPDVYGSHLGLNSWLFYELAMTNGAPDAAFPGYIPFSVNSGGNLYQIDTFNTGNKAFEGRVFFNPFIKEEGSIFQHLGFGFAGSAMSVINQIGLPAYLSIGRNVVFQFSSLENYSIAQGRRNRYHPQFLWSFKNFSVVGDYIISTQNLSNHFSSNIKNYYDLVQQVNHAGNLEFIWNITGEDFSIGSNYTPNNNYKPFDRVGTGAFQLGFRLTNMNLDPSVFNKSYVNDAGETQYYYSDPRTSIQKATAYGVVLNWLWNLNFRLSTEFSYTKFKGGCSTGALNAPINAGCGTAANQYIAQPGSTVVDRPAEIVVFQQASLLF